MRLSDLKWTDFASILTAMSAMLAVGYTHGTLSTRLVQAEDVIREQSEATKAVPVVSERLRRIEKDIDEIKGDQRRMGEELRKLLQMFGHSPEERR